MESFPELIVESLNQTENKKNIVLVSTNPGEGTTTASLAIAYALYQNQSKKVLLIDGNFVNPSLHSFFNINLSPGFCDIIANPKIPLNQIIHLNRNMFDIMTCGLGHTQIIKGMLPVSVNEVIKTIQVGYDHVFIDMGSLRKLPVTNNILSLFDGVIFIVACESTKWEVAQNEKKKLETAGVNFLGTIMNNRKYYIPKWLYNYI